MILYEYPFNERVRTYLRLEQLFRRLGELVRRDSAIDHHYALATIFEIMDVGARADLKSDILKDIDRQKQALNGFRGDPAISEAALDDITGQLEACATGLKSLSGKLGHALMQDDWLMAIRARITIPGATFQFDLPAYHAWQHHSAASRQHDLQGWIAPLMGVAQALDLLLRLLRNSGTAQKVITSGGLYQQMLPQERHFQMMRLRLHAALGLIPEISCNHLMVSVRLMSRASDGHFHTSTDNSTFELTLCA